MSTIIPFRLVAVGANPITEQGIALDINDFCIASGFKPLFADDGTGTGTLSLTPTDFADAVTGQLLARIDAERDAPYALSFNLASGRHVNFLVTQQVDGAEADLVAKVSAYLGLAQTGTSYPVAANLSTYTNPAIAGVTTGGQVWPMTSRGSVLIAPPPATFRRV